MTTGLTTTTNFIAQKIDRTMVDSVTNAIFQRAASKSSQAVENSVKNNVYSEGAYRASVQEDVMLEARRELTKAANPFANNILAQAATDSKGGQTQAGASYVPAKVSGTKAPRTQVFNSMALQNSRESMMAQAQDSISKNYTLMSRLQFLNTKSAIATYPAKNFS